MELQDLGIKGAKLDYFNEKGITEIEDLINYLPKKYYDFREPVCVNQLINSEIQAIIGKVYNIKNKNNNKIITIKLKDKNNNSFGVTFLNQPFKMKEIDLTRTYIICGKVSISEEYNYYASFINPIIFDNNISKYSNLYPIYSKVKKTSEKFVQEKIHKALDNVKLDEYLEDFLIKKYNLISYKDARQIIHKPNNLEELERAKFRLLFDDLFQFNFKLKQKDIKNKTTTEIEIKNFSKTIEFMNSLPFQITEGQRSVLRKITSKMKKQEKVNALIQGDVGSGKTIVALLLMSVLADNNYQACLVAPTEILAAQHYEEAKKLMRNLGFKIEYLTGKMKKREQKKIIKKIKEGECDIIIGTHSLMNENIEFYNLGIAIIDEEHRFGVEQRNTLKREGIHIISMSATPIPRTVAMSLYGANIDIETINTMPIGRKQVKTNIINIKNKQYVYNQILKELQKGKQAYIVCPLIKTNNSEKMKNIISIEQEIKNASEFFNQYGYKISYITGDTSKDKELDINDIINDYKENKIQVLIATTIIEVGVNNPNATIIAILNAERFGFSQIHQLRGRVGRGNDQSYCYLLSENEKKFEIFTQTSDGFEIAKEDLKIRGAGTFLGTQQSGSNKFLMLIIANENLNNAIRHDLNMIYKNKDAVKKYCEFMKFKNIKE